MPRNGTGTYSAPSSTWNPGVNGVTATTADFNTLLTDMSAAITQSVSADGQTPMSGNLPMGNNKVTGLAAGTSNTDAVNLGQVNLNTGQCRLVKSGANIVLVPFQGNRLTINGVAQTVPSGGVSLAPTGSTPTTLYYIYAYMNVSTMTLEYSTTGHSTDTTTGVEIKTGDASRTLVGMARPIAGPAWQSTASQQFVISWFNQRPLQLQSVLASATAIAFATYGEISASLRNEFLVWGGSVVQATFQGGATINTGGSVLSTTLPLDSISATYESFSQAQAYAVNAFVNPYCSLTVLPSEGYHLITPLALVTGGATVNYSGGGTPGLRCVNSAVIQG